jgi:hypothetical protein
MTFSAAAEAENIKGRDGPTEQAAEKVIFDRYLFFQGLKPSSIQSTYGPAEAVP